MAIHRTAPRLVLLAAAALALAGCARDRPAGIACSAFGTSSAEASRELAEAAPAADLALGEGALANALRRSLQPPSVAESAPEAGGPAAVATDAVQGDVAVFSAGGTWGAFGAGVVSAWTGRPDFTLVTGVSTGAILGYFAFAGPEYDDVLRRFYREARLSDAYRIDIAGDLTGRPSVASAAPIERLAATEIPLALPAIKAHSGNGALYVGAVNLDDGQFQAFNLTRAAERDDADTCVPEAVLASAAIPALAPPRVINGAAYVDGGARQQVFLDTLALVAAEEATPRYTIHLIVNSDVATPPGRPDWSLLGVTERAYKIVLDEGLKASLRQVLRIAREQGWPVRAATAAQVDFTPCEALESDPRAHCRSRVLYDLGTRIGQPDNPWLDADGLENLIR